MPATRLIVWDAAACWRVRQATLCLLEETGVEVRHEGAWTLPAYAGHAVDGEPDGLDLADGNSYFGTGSDCVPITDPDTEERWQAMKNDVEGMAALAEQLANIDFVMSMGLPRDVPTEVGDLALALNEIDAVGLGRSHLGRDHTRRHHRETWAPTLFDRAAYERWHAAGATTLKERVHLQTEALRQEPRAFALEDSIRERLSATLAEEGRSGA